MARIFTDFPTGSGSFPWALLAIYEYQGQLEKIYLCFQIYFLKDQHCKTHSDLAKKRQNLLNLLQGDHGRCSVMNHWILSDAHNNTGLGPKLGAKERDFQIDGSESYQCLLCISHLLPATSCSLHEWQVKDRNICPHNSDRNISPQPVFMIIRHMTYFDVLLVCVVKWHLFHYTLRIKEITPFLQIVNF